MATTPQGALLLPQGRYIHLFQPLHTHRRVTVLGVVGGGGVGGGGHKALRITSGAPTPVGRNKYYLEFFAASGRQRLFRSCILFQAYLINCVKFFKFTFPG